MNNNISEQVWNRLYSFLRGIKGLHTQEEKRLRRFIEGIWYILRTGCQWRLLPDYYGHWRQVHRRYKAWSDRGIWSELMCSVSDIDDQAVMIDATIVRAHACASGYSKQGNEAQALGRSKGGFTTKIHAVVDGLGNPIRFTLTGGHRNDITQAAELLKEQRNTLVLADKGYDSQPFISSLKSHNCCPVIPSRKHVKCPRKIDNEVYKERFLIETFFSKIKHFRRVFSRFDKTISAFLGFIHFAGALIWMR
ncbi:IS5 family transposase [Legionella spiritensis]|uniref:Transposase n=1 Tax=Legionella spiritensis TaxID=452 RepID=A0A0W0Z5U1_LEGSP|nr:IS5 family transposase [Legionella spiritensis]KTD64500.1 transposase [Legionella spiritensis]SNV23538.1 transposase [Legionella spiritensis]SNV29955.1 transposase [Legionella spiritensis]SNV33224.1 transposase [Legionella spiritensis]SNV35243.1 transposase [Legionella spiritensis]